MLARVFLFWGYDPPQAKPTLYAWFMLGFSLVFLNVSYGIESVSEQFLFKYFQKIGVVGFVFRYNIVNQYSNFSRYGNQSFLRGLMIQSRLNFSLKYESLVREVAHAA